LKQEVKRVSDYRRRKKKKKTEKPEEIEKRKEINPEIYRRPSHSLGEKREVSSHFTSRSVSQKPIYRFLVTRY
jgi:hypothetical protein